MYIEVKTLVKTFIVKKLIGGSINISYILYEINEIFK